MANGNIVKCVRCLGIQQRIQEPKRREAFLQTGVVEESDETSECGRGSRGSTNQDSSSAEPDTIAVRLS